MEIDGEHSLWEWARSKSTSSRQSWKSVSPSVVGELRQRQDRFEGREKKGWQTGARAKRTRNAWCSGHQTFEEKISKHFANQIWKDFPKLQGNKRAVKDREEWIRVQNQLRESKRFWRLPSLRLPSPGLVNSPVHLRMVNFDMPRSLETLAASISKHVTMSYMYEPAWICMYTDDFAQGQIGRWYASQD